MEGLFGSFASASGYGQSHGGGYGKEIECNSALGLIGLLGLIELLRKLLGGGLVSWRRRKPPPARLPPRPSCCPCCTVPWTPPTACFPPACFERTVCETNRALASEGTTWGVPGAFLTNSTSSLITSVVAKAFTSDEDAYTRALQAGETGRAGVNCETAYSTCLDPRPEYSVVEGVDVKSVVRRQLADLT
ncbi:hypothetical protein O3P69_007109 [Scylla paramamosain]|uniref:Uncharacterized protein n=1 Tax=Scylla paramamosain TaxID=85552 RepID=A0AAW0V6A5_SCYPA